MSKTILIVDDNNRNLQVLGSILRDHGFLIIPAQSGFQALDILPKRRPDLILLDIMMPELDGLELCRRIKSNPAWLQIPVIFLTARSDTDDIVAGFEAGAVDYISKPFHSRELLARVQTHLELQEVREALEKKNQRNERELNLASQIEKSLLPCCLPKIAGYEIAYRYQPAHEVGGDFLDILHEPERQLLGLFICDVSGHGVAAAILAAMVKISLNSWSDFLPNPAALLAHIKKSMTGKLAEHFVTAMAVTVDLASHKAYYSHAGHPPLLLRRKNGAIVQLKGRGPAIIDFFEADFYREEITLQPGDQLVLFTDGLTEAKNRQNQLLGDERFFDLVATGLAAGPDEGAAQLLQKIADFRGEASFDDDLSILVLKYQGPA